MSSAEARVYSPVGYLPGVMPGGLWVDANGSAAYVVDQGWPAQADAASPDNLPPSASEDTTTLGGAVCKVNLDSKTMQDDGDWPSLAVYSHISILGGSAKPYFGPTMGTFPTSGKTFTYVVAHAAREVAPGVRAVGDTRNGLVYVLEPDGNGLKRAAGAWNPVSAPLFGPAGLTLDTAARHAYVTNRRAAGGDPKLLRFDVDPNTGALGNPSPVSLTPGALRPSSALGALLFRQEGGAKVLYIADEPDDPAAARGTQLAVPGDAGKRGRILRVVLSGTSGATTVFATDLDRPVALAAHQLDANDPTKFDLFALCAWPRSRLEVGVDPGNTGQFCLPPWRTWTTPFGTVRRIVPAANLNDPAAVETFTPALVEPGGLAVVGDDLYVVAVAGAPEAPTSMAGSATALCPNPQPLWPWRPPPSAMIYKVRLV